MGFRLVEEHITTMEATVFLYKGLAQGTEEAVGLPALGQQALGTSLHLIKLCGKSLVFAQSEKIGERTRVTTSEESSRKRYNLQPSMERR